MRSPFPFELFLKMSSWIICLKSASVAAVHRLSGQAGGKKTKYTAGDEVQQPRSEDGILEQ